MNKKTQLGAASALAFLLAACGGGGGGTEVGGPTATPMGTMRVALTDAPSCGYDKVNITVQKIRVHKSESAADGDAGWSEIVLAPALRVDLLSLTNGALAELGQTALPAGRYTQLRFVLAANDATTPLANSVTPTGGAETALKTPSAMQSGLKMNVGIEVPENQVADLVLDFDACRSVVKLGNSGGFNLKPVVTVLPRISNAASVTGFVPPALASTTAVSAQQAGVTIKSTMPDATGRFVLAPLPVGNYDVVIASSGRATATVTGVPVSSTANTVLNSSATPIDAPLSAMRLASGVVTLTPTVSPIEAMVVARKSYSGGPTVEVAAQPVDGSTGAFALQLPAAAPVRAAYVAGAALQFSPDASVPVGAYALVASSGSASKTLAIDISSADVSGLNIALP